MASTKKTPTKRKKSSAKQTSNATKKSAASKKRSAVAVKKVSRPSKANKKATSVKKTKTKSRARVVKNKVSTHLTHPAVAHATHQVATPTHHRRHLAYGLLLIVGISLMLGGGLYLMYRQTILSFKVSPVYQVTAEERASLPQQIKINDVGIELDVIPAYIENGIWQTSDTAATHLATSARPGEKSNMVIYGHNRAHLFRDLHQVDLDDVITVISSDGHEYQYKVVSRNVVTPDAIELVLPTDHEELTIYTCTGFLDTKRLVLKAVPISVNYSL